MAEIKELQKGKEQPIVYESGYTGSAWGADPKTKVVSYGIGVPLFCEGKGIKPLRMRLIRVPLRLLNLKKSVCIRGGRI